MKDTGGIRKTLVLACLCLACGRAFAQQITMNGDAGGAGQTPIQQVDPRSAKAELSSAIEPGQPEEDHGVQDERDDRPHPERWRGGSAGEGEPDHGYPHG